METPDGVTSPVGHWGIPQLLTVWLRGSVCAQSHDKLHNKSPRKRTSHSACTVVLTFSTHTPPLFADRRPTDTLRPGLLVQRNTNPHSPALFTLLHPPPPHELLSYHFRQYVPPVEGAEGAEGHNQCEGWDLQVLMGEK